MPISKHPRLSTAAVALLSLPVAMAPGRCGFLLDYTETFLITEEVGRVELGVDDGSVIATMYKRECSLIKRHTFGFEPSVGLQRDDVIDGVLELESRCKYDGNCRFDHMFELPEGVDFSVIMADSQISLGYFTGDIEVSFESGWFKGVRLESPNFTLSLTTGDVTADFAAAPESVAIEVGDGDVKLEVPAGEYRCDLASAAGKVASTGITCNAAAAAVLDVQVQTGAITVTGVEP
jgi:hypothetical protein